MTQHRRIDSTYALIPAPPGGAGGGKGGGGKETADNLRSRQTARIIDLLGEGPNVGIVGWTKGIFYDGVPLQNADGTFNFSNAIVQQVLGTPDQPVLSGFDAQETEVAVGQEIKKPTPIVRHIDNVNADRVRLTLSVPSLQTIDDKGNIKGATVQFSVYIQNNGGGYADRGTYTITGKTSSAYQRQVIFALPAPGPWDVRVTRVTADSSSTKLQNQLYWDSFTEIVDVKVNYTNSHCVGTIIDAEQFGTIPARTYLVDGREVLVPSNYNPQARTYSPAVWDGTFKTAWTNNPAWCLYDMLTHTRYGLGRFFAASQKDGTGHILGTPDVDKWALYEIAKWCDENVPNGKGGLEPRFVCNAVIKDQNEAFDLLNAMASVFRGFLYWNGGQVVAVADKPRLTTAGVPVTATNASVGIYNASNVIDGVFTYSGADVRARHNMITARWLDGDNLGAERFSVAEDRESISKYGIQDLSLDVYGATTESQALRSAKWTLYTENYEAETVQFSVGLGGAWCQPGDIIGIADITVGGERRGGRVWAGSTNSKVTLDGTVTIAATKTGYLSCIVGEGKVEVMRVTSVTNANGRSTLNLFNAFSAAPKPGTPWVLSTDDLAVTLWRVITVTDAADAGTYEVSAVSHNPGKWDYVEDGKQLSQPDISNIQLIPPAVTGLKVEESLIQINVNMVGVVALVSWVSSAPYWDVEAVPDEGNPQRQRSVTTAFELQVTEGWWTFNVTPISLLGRKGPTKSVRKEIVGRYAPPVKVENFRVIVQGGVALFRWTPSTEIDVIVGGHFELRFSPRTDGSAKWDTSTPVVDTVPGSASSTESFYQPGTWMLRTFDILGLASPDVAEVLILQTDESYQQFVRICEQPNWQGTHDGTVAEDHGGEDWLVLDYGSYGGLWDDQLDPMDSWPVPAVDELPGGSTSLSGTYNFFNQINMGGIFTTRLSLDMLSTPYFPNDPTMDNRGGTMDSWADWDASSSDLDGTVRIEMRSTNDDPAGPAPVWSAWRPFTAGDNTGYAFQFRAVLKATAGQNVAVQELCILADVSNKIDENRGAQSGGITYPGSKYSVAFNIKFQSTPAITITMQSAAVGDYVVLSNKTRYGFDIEIKNGSAQVTGRKFDWHAMGY